jgi:exopolyphosphatase / guanosine-5'-triphosphate,3'-diphosphate pyrophosphatase
VTPPSRRAAVDVGTNSVRLLVRDADGTPLAREMEITRLGRGVDDTGRLDDESLRRTLDVLARYRKIWSRLEVGDVRIAATSAVRDAADRERFFTAVRELTGLEARVLTGEDEARVAFLGATSGVDVPDPTVVLDIGGGSTEIIVGDDDGRLVAGVSLQLGCVRLAERCLSSDPASPEELRAARREVAARLEEGESELAAHGADPSACSSLVGVAGTVTTLAALHLGLDAYDADRIHATRIPASVVDTLTTDLASMTSAQRAALGPMAPGREDVIVAGALVLSGVLDRFGFDAVVTSEADMLDGLVLVDEIP